MAVTRFEGEGPVARYWLARCEGFEVRGSTRGVVEELQRDADPYVTARLVVRTGRRRLTVVPVERVHTVVPAERLLVVERAPKPVRPPRPVRPPVWRPRLRRATEASARRGAMFARWGSRHAAAGTVVAARYARPWLEAAAALLAGSLRRLAVELRASAAVLLRSVSWRRFARSARSASTSRARARSKRSSRRPTT